MRAITRRTPQGNIDLSAALVSAPTGQIYDPNDGRRQWNRAGHPRTPFANNQIPFNRVNPVSLDILQRSERGCCNVWNSELDCCLWGIRQTTTPPIFRLPRARTASTSRSIGRSMKRTTSAAATAGRRSNTFQAPAFGSFLGGPAGGGFQGNWQSDVLQHRRELRSRLLAHVVYRSPSRRCPPAQRCATESTTARTMQPRSVSRA